MISEEQRNEWAQLARDARVFRAGAIRPSAHDLANAVEALLRENAELQQALDQRAIGKHWASHDLALANRRIEELRAVIIKEIGPENTLRTIRMTEAIAADGALAKEKP